MPSERRGMATGLQSMTKVFVSYSYERKQGVSDKYLSFNKYSDKYLSPEEPLSRGKGCQGILVRQHAWAG
jgi:hypothetical protein